MQNFTGAHKKSIAGFVCALFVFFFSHISLAADSALANNQAPIAQSVASQSTVSPAVAVSSVAVDSAQPENIAPASSAPVRPVTLPAKTNSASQLASLVGGLVLILVLIWGLSWFVKRFSQGGFLQNPTMKIVSAMPLGTRERLMLVDVGGKQLLLGVTATQINTLHVFDEPVVQTEKSQAVTSDFSQKLMAILQQKNISPVDDATRKKSNS